MAKTKISEYDKVMDALNLIDEQAEENGSPDDSEKRLEAYEIVSDFIDEKTSLPPYFKFEKERYDLIINLLEEALKVAPCANDAYAIEYAMEDVKEVGFHKE